MAHTKHPLTMISRIAVGTFAVAQLTADHRTFRDPTHILSQRIVGYLECWSSSGRLLLRGCLLRGCLRACLRAFRDSLALALNLGCDVFDIARRRIRAYEVDFLVTSILRCVRTFSSISISVTGNHPLTNISRASFSHVSSVQA